MAGRTGPATPEQQLAQMMRRACEERLFPSLISELEQASPRRLLASNFRKKVISQYSNCLRVPQVYAAGEQLTEWQKVERKIRRIAQRRVPIEYLEMNKDEEGRYFPTYRGHQLDEVPVVTKNEFRIFTEFNEQSFRKHAFDNIFEDRLELKQPSPVHNPYPHNRLQERKRELQPLPQISSTLEPIQERASRRLVTLGSLEQRRTKSPERSNRTKTATEAAEIPKEMSSQRPMATILPPKPSERRNRIYTNFERTLTGRILSGDHADEVAKVFNRIGGYSGRNPNELLTKESLTKYLKRYYDKPYRIIDFLEVPPVMNLESFALLSKRLKVMPRLHFNFMVFVFYDTNHDGVICEGDLSRLQNLAKKLTVLNHDYNRLLKLRQPPGVNTTLEQGMPSYLELYNLPEITESVVFDWFKTHSEHPHSHSIEQSVGGSGAEVDSALLGMYRKKYSIRFERFNSVFRHDKPTLWYELLYRLAGLCYEGVHYAD